MDRIIHSLHSSCSITHAHVRSTFLTHTLLATVSDVLEGRDEFKPVIVHTKAVKPSPTQSSDVRRDVLDDGSEDVFEGITWKDEIRYVIHGLTDCSLLKEVHTFIIHWFTSSTIRRRIDDIPLPSYRPDSSPSCEREWVH